MATIKYFVPEDGDTEEHPNIFMLPKSTQSGSSPRLGDVRDNFPMPGKYHFRFKSPLIPGTDREKGAVAVWMDCVQDDQHVAVWKNSIFAKVTRISMDDDDDDDEDNFDNGHQPTYAPHNVTNGHAAPRQVPVRRPVAQQRQQPAVTQMAPPSVAEDKLLDVFDDPTPTRRTTAAPPAVTNSMNLLDHPSLTEPTNHGHGHGHVQGHGHGNSEGSLLNMDHDTYQKTDSASDFLGMTATAPAPAAHVPVAQQAIPPARQSNPTSPTFMNQPQGQNMNGNAFSAYPPQNGPFGGLEWK
eukprot:CAMPEP_0198264120 /NCGR_PEP_ID=MMETSP1447-20131203/14896_1 /TAXON_ID=420782 /ORGANISM="Chaetoceros dichaeta, Strain CCMP1751" /LENGTH=296 /DNA_ID=CAMNT_0043952969 /DNA_START=103 /DNA_END=993 /DNA_ORIENTATION=+